MSNGPETSGKSRDDLLLMLGDIIGTLEWLGSQGLLPEIDLHGVLSHKTQRKPEDLGRSNVCGMLYEVVGILSYMEEQDRLKDQPELQALLKRLTAPAKKD